MHQSFIFNQCCFKNNFLNMTSRGSILCPFIATCHWSFSWEASATKILRTQSLLTNFLSPPCQLFAQWGTTCEFYQYLLFRICSLFQFCILVLAWDGQAKWAWMCYMTIACFPHLLTLSKFPLDLLESKKASHLDPWVHRGCLGQETSDFSMCVTF